MVAHGLVRQRLALVLRVAPMEGRRVTDDPPNVRTLPPGYAEGIDGTPIEITRWCPTCRLLTLARDHDQRCLFCDAATVPAVEADA